MISYVSLVKNILDYGIVRSDRTGIGSKFIWGAQIKLDNSNSFPAVSARPVPLRWVFEETMFFLRGRTQTKELEKKGVSIWKGNTTREFLDKRGMKTLDDKPWPEGDMGRGYGYQWRNFGADVHGHYGIDQLQTLVVGLSKNPGDRRHLISAWNPKDLDKTALPPCHVLQHHYILNGELFSQFWMRSNDVIYGLPFNLCQYAFIQAFLAKLLQVKPGQFLYQCSDAHIYMNQIQMAKQMVERFTEDPPESKPKILIKKDLQTLDDMLALEWKDIEIYDYNPLPDFDDKPPMAV